MQTRGVEMKESNLNDKNIMGKILGECKNKNISMKELSSNNIRELLDIYDLSSVKLSYIKKICTSGSDTDFRKIIENEESIHKTYINLNNKKERTFEDALDILRFNLLVHRLDCKDHKFFRHNAYIELASTFYEKDFITKPEYKELLEVASNGLKTFKDSNCFRIKIDPNYYQKFNLFLEPDHNMNLRIIDK